jgi:hypothetical protein
MVVENRTGRYSKNTVFLTMEFRFYLSIRLFFNSCRRLPETKRHFSLFLHWSGSKFHAVMAPCTPYIHFFIGLPFFFLFRNLEFRFLFWKYKVEVDIQRNEFFMRHISPVDWNINLITLQFSTDLTFGGNRWKKKDSSACSRNCGRDFFCFLLRLMELPRI